jgi:uncharacterized integral membrane protein
MKAKTKQTVSPAYIVGYLLLSTVYFAQAAPYLNNLTSMWFAQSTLGEIVNMLLFVGGSVAIWFLYDKLAKKIGLNEPRKTDAVFAKRALAIILDLVIALMIFSTLTLFILGAYNQEQEGVSVSGWRAFFPILLTLIYFVVMDRYFGGTIGKRLLGINKSAST